MHSLKRLWEFAQFLVYVFFAGYLVLNLVIPIFLGVLTSLNKIWAQPFLADLFFSGAVDILFAAILSIFILVIFANKGKRPFNGLLNQSLVFGFVFGAILFYGFLLFSFFSAVGLLFYLLVLFYFLKNFVFIVLGKSREKILARYNMIYGMQLKALLVASAIWAVSIIILALISLPPENHSSHTEIAAFFFGAVPIYYAITAITSLKRSLKK